MFISVQKWSRSPPVPALAVARVTVGHFSLSYRAEEIGQANLPDRCWDLRHYGFERLSSVVSWKVRAKLMLTFFFSESSCA